MHSKAVSAVAMLLAIRPALADFRIYCGTNSNVEDGTANVVECYFLNNPPSCNDINNSVPHTRAGDNDASFSGLACEGCDAPENPKGWDITRLEYNDHKGKLSTGNYFEGAGEDLHFTIYKGDDSITMVDTDGKQLGTCTIPDDPQIVDCNYGFEDTYLKNTFNCETVVTYNESPN